MATLSKEQMYSSATGIVVESLVEAEKLHVHEINFGKKRRNELKSSE